jgi:hypothetical protein
VGGCATVSSLTEKLNSTQPCCTDFSQVAFKALPVGEELSFSLDDKSPVFNFDVGKSYFIGFSLPPESKSRMLQVMALPTGSTAFETTKLAQIFCPRVLFLGKDKQQIEVREASGEFLRGTGFSGLRFGATSSMKIPEGTAYIVLHSNPATFGDYRTLYTRGGAYTVGSTLVIDRGGEPINFPCAPNADAKIRIN